MRRSGDWFLVAAVLAVTFGGCLAAGVFTDVGTAFFGMTGCVAAASLVVLICYDRTVENAKRGFPWRLVGDLLWGSALIGALYFGVLIGVRPQPGPHNIVWVILLPFLVAIVQQRQWPGVLRGFPLAAGGFISFAALAMASGLPID